MPNRTLIAAVLASLLPAVASAQSSSADQGRLVARASRFVEAARRDEAHLKDAGYHGTAEGLQHPQVNIEYGTKYSGILLAAYKGDVQAAIAAYNSGGEFGNQPCVASVLVFARKYGSTEPIPAVRGPLITKGATPAPVVSGCSCRARV